MDDLPQLAALLGKRNAFERDITALIGRPAAIGHIGEYVASKIFQIALEESASRKAIDGRFTDGPLAGRTVNVKWYALWEGMLDIRPDAFPDYYLVLAGPQSVQPSSRGQSRPWLIAHVFLFDAAPLVGELERAGVKIGIATSLRRNLWTSAEVYPEQHNKLLTLTEDQQAALALFGPQLSL